MSCPCDEQYFPQRKAIAAGLSRFPRALGTFPDWRQPILASIGREPALDQWRARLTGDTEHDLGLMLVDMGAYVFDVVSFYDQLIANETYLGTAQLTGAQRRLVEILGYLPRPALASEVLLAAQADGIRTVNLPAGTAFRSGEFDGHPPQVFELNQDTVIDPRLNAFAVDRVQATHLPATFNSLLAEPASVRLKAGQWFAIDYGTTYATTQLVRAETVSLRSQQVVSRLSFNTSLTTPSGQTYEATRLLSGGALVDAWKLGSTGSETAVVSGSTVLLDSRVTVGSNELVLIEYNGAVVARRITSSIEEKRIFLSSQSSTITNSSNQTSTLTSPAIYVSVTRLNLDSALPWTSIDVNRLNIHYRLERAAQLVAPLRDTLTQADTISIPGLQDPPRVTPDTLLLEDVHGNGVETGGTLDFTTHRASVDATPAWAVENTQLWAPVTLYGSVLKLSRGETVRGETLGIGDASLSEQSFSLKKKPLTYLRAANAAGRVSTLEIFVNGIQWQEVNNFYVTKNSDTAYIVRHDDVGGTTITFGGAACLPTGAMVVANYRYGAGAEVPPAGSVKQVAKPVAGLRRVHNVLPAYGGAEAETAHELSIYAPRSALLLGRAISLSDLEAAALQVSGVKAARAGWRWQSSGLRPAAIITYIGDAQSQADLNARLRALSEPDAPIALERSTPQAARLDVDIEIDALYEPNRVINTVLDELYAEVELPGTGGYLREENLGPGGIIFLSQLIEKIISVAGVVQVRSVLLDRLVFTDTARSPATGSHFDFSSAGVWVNGTRR